MLVLESKPWKDGKTKTASISSPFAWCAEHDQQLEGESPSPNRMEVNG
jgi:hypothetical protein